MKRWKSRSISRVLSWTTIPLGRPLLTGSSHLPADSASRVIVCLFGVAPDGGYRVSPELNTLVSVALFLASRRTAVSRHPALCSPDFPPPIARRRLSSQLQMHFNTLRYHSPATSPVKLQKDGDDLYGYRLPPMMVSSAGN